MTARLSSLALLLAAACAAPLQAEDSEPYSLQPALVVTPTRGLEERSEALASVTVISREDIELSVAEDLLELLRLQPGLDIVRTGGPGAQTSVFLRGSNSNHVLVLVDGVRVSSANTGAYAWELLPLNQVERVEIVRGPRGSLYGSDSIGGVIQVFTRSDPAPYGRLTAGSYDSLEAEGGLGYRGDRTHLSVNAGFRDVGGFSAQNPDGFSYHPDDDGHRSANLGIKGSTDATAGRWNYSLLAIDTESEFDQGESDASQLIGSLGFDGVFSDNWAFQLHAGYVRDELFTNFGFFTTDFDSRRAELSWQNQLGLGAGGQLNFGIDYDDEHGRSAESWSRSRRNAGLFGAWDLRRGRAQLQLGGRYDDNSRFGGRFTGQVALGVDLGQYWQVFGSYGSAFRGPNLSEQFSPGFGGLFAGNPDLDPESSRSAEIGVRHDHPALGQFSASAYRTDVEDLIAFNGPQFQAINIDEARLEGLELGYDLSIEGWQFTASATLQETEDRSSGQRLLRRPDRKAAVALTRRFGGGHWLGAEWFHSGSSSDFGGVELGSYTLLNLRAGWAIDPSWRLELRGENLLDEVYEPAFGFNAAGRSWYFSLAWTP